MLCLLVTCGVGGKVWRLTWSSIASLGELCPGKRKLLLGAVEFRVKWDLGSCQGSVAVAPFRRVLFLALGWERARSDITTLKRRCWASD